MTQKGLNKQVSELLKAKDYSGVVALLDDVVLRATRDSILYYSRGLAHMSLNNNDQAMLDVVQSIEINPEYSDAYSLLGVLWNRKEEFDKAIISFNKAIEFNHKNAEAFYSRGNAWAEKGNYTKSVEDHSQAIKLKPTMFKAYYGRGFAWYYLTQYEKAIADFTEAIKLDPNSLHASYCYNSRGVCWKFLKNYEKAIEDYERAIKLNPDFSGIYYNMGEAYGLQKKLAQSLKYYDTALKMEPENKEFQKQRDETQAKIGEQISRHGEEEYSVYYVENEIKGLPENDRKPIRRACAAINAQVERIRRIIIFKDNHPLVHYTRLKIADVLVSNDNSALRYSNVVFMNDPEEGKIFLEYLGDPALRNAFERGTLEADNNIYLGSFLPEDKADYLVMWRTYGKNEHNEEATGCSIVIQSDFFDHGGDRIYADMQYNLQEEISGKKHMLDKQSLYHVLYYDKSTGRLVFDDDPAALKDLHDALDEFKQTLQQLLKLKDKAEETPKNIAINKFVYRYISELRYFFKSADYQFERELRVIKYYLPDNPAVKVDTNAVELPRRLYIESTKTAQPYISKIILGPKVPHPERWLYLEAIMKQKGYADMKLQRSVTKFQ